MCLFTFLKLILHLLRVLNKLTLAVRPLQPIPPRVEVLTGLSNANLAHQATWGGGVGAATVAFLTLLEPPVCIVAHNGNRFDFPLLKRELEVARSSFLLFSFLFVDRDSIL